MRRSWVLGILTAVVVSIAAPRLSEAWEASRTGLPKRVEQLAKWREQPGWTPMAVAEKKRAPGWTKKTAWIEGDAEGRVAFAVGIASGIANPSLRQRAAENRARSEMNKLIHGVRVQRNAHGVRARSSGTLTGVLIVDWYYQPTTGVFMALAAKPLSADK